MQLSPIDLLLLLLVTSRAAAEHRHAIQARLDLGVQSVRDDTLVPIAHTGPRLALAPRYFGDFDTLLLLADARVGMGAVLSRAGEEGLTLTWGLRISPLFVLATSEDSKLWLGPTLAWDNETFLFATWDDAHAYWIGTRWLGPRVRGVVRINQRWRLDWDGQFSLVGFVSRPPAYRKRKQETSNNVLRFMTWPVEDPEFGWLLDFQVLRAALDFYRTPVGPVVPAGLGLGEEWIAAATSTQVQSDVDYGEGSFGYGYYFWIVPEVGFTMAGHGGQFVLVVPSRNLVLVQTAFPDTDLPDSSLLDFLGLVGPLLGPP